MIYKIRISLVEHIIRLRRIIAKFNILLLLCSLLTSCAPSPPNNIENICSIFKQYPSWYWDASSVQAEWGLPISVLMAIIYQESQFRANAAPPREKLLWIIPWKRPTSAYGYSQAINGTWKNYQLDTGRMSSNRDAFGDAASFVGWFTYQAHIKVGIPMNNAFELYLAYHEGIGGYQLKTYRSKPWLVTVAHKVQLRAQVYRAQLILCKNSLPKKPWWWFWHN
ncbi:MAG: hypothetical protein A3E87_08140 [Gammaproteobacteria bacterium RIFCSPHIGHO2_12_FULL_35_23]|nr:MAG: hypothetical protein A3E87_08140 [Gammaproteobacteria bacterium RIFCSPHIGHO2_12_FULL_35_23]